MRLVLQISCYQWEMLYDAMHVSLKRFSNVTERLSDIVILSQNVNIFHLWRF